MKFYTYGSPENKAVVLIHGVMTPYRIWQEHWESLMNKYYVIVPALDAHDETEKSEFISIEDEAEKIENYVINNLDGRVYAVCGLSMGGAIANVIFDRRKIKTEKLVLDGAPLVPMNGLLVKIMTSSYLSILHGAQKREPKVLESFKKDFLPEKYLGPFLKFADTMSDSSIKNMLSSVFGSTIAENGDKNTKVLFLHGTKGNESAAKRSAALFKRRYENTQVISYSGYAHCQLCIYDTKEWIRVVSEFLEK